ncbi:uncharacterized protein LOC119349705 isoform X3 [Triticum dicoccoides]|uniref:Uncharacterized protein n=1 Tax=Triticum aestivum TaxID=4565 RepID=A0A3B5Z4Z0_WHEAT|nr:uncharacterized protein LOC119349705 isoform X3 [Triticum dicoccoides]XP_044377979.1 uncharacterized protein LOC123100047 [Triticum aestivum]
MAALRVAARRLVGGGQTPAVAVDKAQRRLFPRLSQVDRARSTTSSAAAAADTNLAAAKGGEDREKLLTEIHNMREELYDKVLHAQRTYNIPGRAGKNFSRLREELAMQVDPRPWDTTWRHTRFLNVLERCIGFAALSFSSYVLMGMAVGKIVELDPDEKQWIKKKRGGGTQAK